MNQQLAIKSGVPVLDFKAADAPGEFEGYASTFGGEPDSYGDVIAPGAYAASLARHKEKGTLPKLFWQHDPDRPIGKWLDLREDDKGLWGRARLNMKVQQGAEAYELLRAGDIDGLSIGYRIKAYEADTETGIWTLTEIDLREVSVVSLGANESATVTDIKSMRAISDIKKKLAAGDRLTEREFEQMAKGALGLSNSQAERAARIHLKGPGEPDAKAVEGMQFLQALAGQ